MLELLLSGPVAQSVPALDFAALVSAAFGYANTLIPTFAAIAGIAIGFPLVLGMINYLGGILGRLFKGGR